MNEVQEHIKACNEDRRNSEATWNNRGFQLIADGAELGFTWRECELCSAKAGDRYKASALKITSGCGVNYSPCCARHEAGERDTEIEELSVCADCLCYLANGDEPDPDNYA